MIQRVGKDFITIKEAHKMAKEKGLNLSMYQIRYLAQKNKTLGKQMSKWGRWYVRRKEWEKMIHDC